MTSRRPLACLGLIPLILSACHSTGDRAPAEPAIELESCIRVPVTCGPEDLVGAPGGTSVIVSSSCRGLIRGEPRGRIVEVDLERCQRRLEPGCDGGPRRLFPPLGDPLEHFSPVGLALHTPPGGRPELLFVDSRGRRVHRLSLDGETVEPPAEDAKALTSALNGLGVGPRGEVLASNAWKTPSLAYLPAIGGKPSGSWKAIDEPTADLAFANGIAFLPQAAGDRSPPRALVADFWRGTLLLFELGPEPRHLCTIAAPGLPDNLHWEDGAEGTSLIVATWGSRAGASAYFGHLKRGSASAVWQLDLSTLRDWSPDRPPETCGIGRNRWQLLLRDDRSRHLAGASAAVRLGELLVVGQLRRPWLLVCPWPADGAAGREEGTR